MEVKTKLRSPIHYMGNKYTLIGDIFELIPSDTKRIHDVFGGSGVVSLNAVYNGLKANYVEKDPNVYSMFKVFSGHDYQKIRQKVESIIKRFDLPMNGEDIRQRKEGNETREYYKKNYMTFRQYYNNFKHKLSDYERTCFLWVLSSYSFGRNFRFNKKGGFNMPFGNNPFQESNFELIKNLNEQKHGLTSFNLDAFQYLNGLARNDKEVIYLDPPYINTTAVYNEQGRWDEQADIELLKVLDTLNALGHKWILSNAFVHKGKTNHNLIEWSKKYRVRYPKKTYSALGKGNAKSQEVLIYNYPVYKKEELF